MHAPCASPQLSRGRKRRGGWWLVLPLAATAAVAFGPVGQAAGSEPATPSDVDAASLTCPSVGTAWAEMGPFSVTTQKSGVGHTIYRPAELGGQGCGTHPVILWGNGTGVNPSAYDSLLRHFASHGFIVAAANTTWAGSGTAMLGGLDYLTRQNSTSGSVFHGKVNLDKVGATGHSQGGGGAVNAAEDARVDASAPIQPGPYGTDSIIKGPALYLAGQNDSTVSSSYVEGRFAKADQVVAVFGELAGADHYEPAGNGGGFRGPVTAWFRFHLMGDEQARGEFFGAGCGYCSSPVWSDYKRNAKAEAVSGT